MPIYIQLINKKELKGLIEKLLKERIKGPQGTKLKIEKELEEGGCGKHSAGKNEDEPEAVVEEGEACGPHGVVGCADCALEENEEIEELGEDLDKLKGGLKNYMKNKAGNTSGDATASVDADDESSDDGSDSSNDSNESSDDSSNDSNESSDEQKKKSSSGKGKKNMVKGPGGKLVPDYAVDGKGSKDLKNVAEGPKIQTPEQENALYESRFTQKNTRLFEKLLKEWTK